MIKGIRLKNRRKELGITQSELGQLIGVGKSAICCYEKETRNPTLEGMLDLIHALGVSADFLIGSDMIIKTVEEKHPKYRTMTNEEITFINELRKDKIVYEILFNDPKRGSDLIKKKIG